MGKVVCFGEIMGRLNPEGYLRFAQSSRYELSFAGGEANVAVSLANYGEEAVFVTKLPDNDIAKCAVSELKKMSVDTSEIVYGGERLGLYFVEKGASQRASKVVYDRAYSSISTATLKDFDFDKIFEGVSWFHFTGITPALSSELAEICLKALKIARDKGITTSCDINYRKKLWTKQKAGEVMSELMPYVDVCLANEEDASDVFGIKAGNTDVNTGKLSREGYVEVAKKLCEKFGFKKVSFTLRGSISASDNMWGAMLYENGTGYFSKEYLMHIVDRVGGGDSFGGGLIYALKNNYEPQKAIDFATAASCLKHSIEHDFNMVTKEEVFSLMAGDGSGRVQR